MVNDTMILSSPILWITTGIAFMLFAILINMTDKWFFIFHTFIGMSCVIMGYFIGIKLNDASTIINKENNKE